MKFKSNMLTHTAIMTAVNLIMKSISVCFNAYLTGKIGSAGIGLFQLIMTVYSLAVTLASSGVKLTSMRLTVEISASRKHDLNKSMRLITGYALFCSLGTAIILFAFADFISIHWISDVASAAPLRILSLSLPFVSLSAALSGYFTAKEMIPQFSFIQMLEQGFKIIITVFLINKYASAGTVYAMSSIVCGMTAAEIFSFSLSYILKIFKKPESTKLKAIGASQIFRIALPDGTGAFMRSLLLTIEHLLIPKGFEKSGSGSAAALSAYGGIHAMALPVLLYPNAVLVSFSTLLIPDLAKRNEIGDIDGINKSVKRNLKRTFYYSLFCSAFCGLLADPLSLLIYKTKEAAQYIKILAPLVPIMYLDTVTDGILKGLDQQIYSMRYNIIDSALCVILVYFLLPKYSIKGYIFILYLSEIINFYLSFNRLIKICDITVFTRIKAVLKPQEDNSIPSRLKRC